MKNDADLAANQAALRTPNISSKIRVPRAVLKIKIIT